MQIKENCDIDTVVGNLATSDEDVGQNHTYMLLDSASGRFKIDGRFVKVRKLKCGSVPDTMSIDDCVFQ